MLDRTRPLALSTAAGNSSRPNVSGIARVDNIFAKRYAGSVIVNEGNARYFEPAPERNWTVGVAATATF